jgi:hypothetical protein
MTLVKKKPLTWDRLACIEEQEPQPSVKYPTRAGHMLTAAHEEDIWRAPLPQKTFSSQIHQVVNSPHHHHTQQEQPLDKSLHGPVKSSPQWPRESPGSPRAVSEMICIIIPRGHLPFSFSCLRKSTKDENVCGFTFHIETNF